MLLEAVRRACPELLRQPDQLRPQLLALPPQLLPTRAAALLACLLHL